LRSDSIIPDLTDTPDVLETDHPSPTSTNGSVSVDRSTNTDPNWLGGSDIDPYRYDRNLIMSEEFGIKIGDCAFYVGIYPEGSSLFTPGIEDTRTMTLGICHDDISIADQSTDRLYFDQEALASYHITHGHNPHRVVPYCE